MCGRFALTDTSEKLLAESFDLNHVPDLSPRYNIAPTQPVATIVQEADSGQRQLLVMHWGLIPRWAKDRKMASRMINARGETAHEKPSFRAAFRYRRCLVIADGFFEWQAQDSGPKQPLFIHLADHRPFGMAGLYEHWTDPDTGELLTTCTIITTAANAFMTPIHQRMPVILPREHYAGWLDPRQTDAAAVRPLLGQYPAGQMAAFPVSRRVNSPANDDPGVIERIG
jgi:putative SOS response-associated peptidase YedK